MDKQQYLPSLTLYRRNCHASAGKYLVYLSSTTELTLLQFTSVNRIYNCINIKIPLEPVKAISLLIYQANIYIAVAFITKFIIYTSKDVLATNQLVLDRNITVFDHGYVAVCNYEDGFAFLRRKGDLHLFNVPNRHTLSVVSKQSGFSYSSIAYSSPQFYLGSEQGKVKTVKLEDNNKQYKQLATFDTTSSLPILCIVPCPELKQVLVGTCEGELYILGEGGFSTVALHRGMVSRMLVVGNRVYSAGEDEVVNRLELVGGRKVKLLESTNSERLVSMLVSINGRPYLSYYENPVLSPIP